MNMKFFRIVTFTMAAFMLMPVIAACAPAKDDKPQETEPVEDTEVVTTAPASDEPVYYSLKGKTLFFLGSSVTYGSANNGVSFVEMIKERNECKKCIKVAVSGTTLVDNGSSSYVQRFIAATKHYKKWDHFICQLSTNDASQNKPLGKVSDSFNMEDFDTSTITGAMEYIIAYAKSVCDAPVSFYTGTKYDSALYQKMVDRLYDLKEKWGIGIIDLWNDEEMNAVSRKDYARYMSDPIHPNGVGYLEWWTPKFEEFLKLNTPDK